MDGMDSSHLRVRVKVRVRLFEGQVKKKRAWSFGGNKEMTK